MYQVRIDGACIEYASLEEALNALLKARPTVEKFPKLSWSVGNKRLRLFQDGTWELFSIDKKGKFIIEP